MAYGSYTENRFMFLEMCFLVLSFDWWFSLSWSNYKARKVLFWKFNGWFFLSMKFQLIFLKKSFYLHTLSEKKSVNIPRCNIILIFLLCSFKFLVQIISLDKLFSNCVSWLLFKQIEVSFFCAMSCFIWNFILSLWKV